MKKIGLLAAILAVSTYHAQIKFEKGYFINNSGEKIEVLIRNLDWKNNPVNFEYKTDETSKVKTESINNVKEFSIDGDQKFIRATVMLDRSSANLDEMSDNKEPDFEKETVFLKYIIEGKAALLYYEDGNIARFFYNSEKSNPEQLIYKAYRINTGSIGYNEDYKKQITEHLKCDIKTEQIQNTAYNIKDLTKLFTQYNECSGSPIIEYKKNHEQKSYFHINIRPGVNFSNLEINSTNGNVKSDFGKNTSLRIGVEFEYVLPFNKNKWSLFVEPTYSYYKSNLENVQNDVSYYQSSYNTSIDYKFIEIPIGIRHYFFLNDKSKIFVNAAYTLSFDINSSFKYRTVEPEIISGNNLVFGTGYKYNDKFSAEFRVGTSRNLFRNNFYLESNYNTVSVILGYTLF